MWFVMDISIRAAVAAFIVGTLLRLLRIEAAAVRHSAWTVVLGAMLLMPLLPSVVPRLPIPVPSRVTTLPPVQQAASEGALAIPAGNVTATVVSPVPGDVVQVQTPDRAEPTPAPRNWFTLAAVAIYVVGVALFLGRLLYGWSIVSVLVRRADRVKTCVYQSPQVTVPFTAGILRPVVILPVSWRSWSREKLEAVLAHEMAHVTRRDPLVAFLACLNRAVFWFHPLAWWLDRKLAVTAEHACDETAARAVAEPRRYAEILLEMAETVRAHRGRIAWQGVGVDGGVLQGRIDRVLRGATSAQMSRMRKATALLACGSAILLVVACRQAATAPPLKPDPEVARRMADQDERTKKWESARDLTQEQADALEQKLATDPNDFEVRRQLVTYYTASGKVPWDKKLSGSRRQALWLIEHHPEHEILPPRISRQYDPEGFAAAKKAWEAHLARPDASPFLVYRAATFFAAQDKPYAEELILRGMQMDPESAALKARLRADVGGYPWPSQLADLYASALIGSESVWGTYNDLRSRPEWLNSSYAKHVRQTVDASKDARLLATIGNRLIRNDLPPEVRELAVRYLNRALELDANQITAKTTLVRLNLESNKSDVDRAAERISLSLTRADSTEYYKQDLNAAKKQRQEVKAQAEDLLKGAASHSGDPTYSAAVMTAHQVLAAVALRDGDRDAAVRHLLDSVKVPTSDRIQYAPPYGWMRPVNRLLNEGEREPIVEFLEAFAKLTVVERQRLLDDAKAIREGRMPSGYQHMMARETRPVAPSPAGRS